MGRPPVELPDESGFPSAYRSGSWLHSTSFQKNTSKILNKHFTSGYIVYESGGMSKFLTTYKKLSGMPERLFGEIAILISHSLNVTSNELYFHIHFKARERKSHTDWRNNITEATKNVAVRFTSDLLAELREVSNEF
jgi:hypothetical protein